MDEEKEPSESFLSLAEKCRRLGITTDQLNTLDGLAQLTIHRRSRLPVIALVLVALIAILSGTLYQFRLPLIKAYVKFYGLDAETEACSVVFPEYVQDFARPPIDCNFCKGISEPHRVTNVSSLEFEDKYAYSGQPVIIEDATTNWTAKEVFSFQYFRKIYLENRESMNTLVEKCQFFLWGQNDFADLEEVFKMDKERAKMAKGTKPWYVGWSNCDPESANKLRQHYSRPYFLPRVSQSSKTDWIFIGSVGYGAPLHLDAVRLPSWQAQIRGQKQWTLEPPSECYRDCNPQMKFVVKAGETIVLDTNRWFHATSVLGNDMSITIGSEYD